METKKVTLDEGEEFIKLGSLLKYCSIIERGSDEKQFLSTAQVLVNDHPENRRGAKIRPGDKVTINGEITIEVCA